MATALHPKIDHWVVWNQYILREGFTPLVLAAVFVIAAFHKVDQLTSGHVPEADLWSTRAFLTSLVVFELALALWLLSGLHARSARYASIAVFFGFLQFVLHSALTGERNCHCFGETAVHPWIMVILDIALLAVLMNWRPTAPGVTAWSHRIRFSFLIILFTATSLPVLVALRHSAPSTLRVDGEFDGHSD